MGDIQSIGKVCRLNPDRMIMTALMLELYQPAAKAQTQTEIKMDKIRSTVLLGLINHLKLVSIKTGD